jgi:hypothetical protein
VIGSWAGCGPQPSPTAMPTTTCGGVNVSWPGPHAWGKRGDGRAWKAMEY